MFFFNWYFCLGYVLVWFCPVVSPSPVEILHPSSPHHGFPFFNSLARCLPPTGWCLEAAKCGELSLLSWLPTVSDSIVESCTMPDRTWSLSICDALPVVSHCVTLSSFSIDFLCIITNKLENWKLFISRKLESICWNLKLRACSFLSILSQWQDGRSSCWHHCWKRTSHFWTVQVEQLKMLMNYNWFFIISIHNMSE